METEKTGKKKSRQAKQNRILPYMNKHQVRKDESDPQHCMCDKTRSFCRRVTVIDLGQAKILASVIFFRVPGFTSWSNSYLTLSRSTFINAFSRPKSQQTFCTPLSD